MEYLTIFTGNKVSNRFFENQGKFRFEDITYKIGLNSDGYWSTCVSYVDINRNGLLDIFVTLFVSPEGN